MNEITGLPDAMVQALSDAKAAEGFMCPLIAFDLIAGGKYKLRTLWTLRNGKRRYGEIRRSLVIACQGEPVTPRVLSRELKDLARRNLIVRTEYPGVPPRVDYELTELGRSLLPIIDSILAWGMTGAQVRILPEAGPRVMAATEPR